MVYVFIGCFIRIWTEFAFPSPDVFQYVSLMQIVRCTFLALRKLDVLLYLFATETGEISLVCLKPRSRSRQNPTKSFA